ncbi:MAG TPA: MOSC N-terminal beta barrel domain-containing protein [Thermoanaerobaculia bacterium]|jgi:hypothetical protein|nr:MOSC N-terminal beta barrel domain-containing protein [Thermoanaerobaculia bacterium]
MHIAELWRYPVKSMAGEPLTRAEISIDGIAGDRAAIVVRDDRIITARTHPRLLRHHATLDATGEPLIDGERWDSDAVAQWVRDDAGPDARLIRYDGPERFDVLPLLVATDGAIRALGEDARRLRPNLIVGGVDGLAERSWEGKFLRVGGVVIRIHDLRQRCVMTTYDPDTQKQNIGVLKKIVCDFDGLMALNCSVEAGGVIEIGQTAEIADSPF